MEHERSPIKLTVSVDEASEMMGISRPMMYQIINRADFNGAFKIGGRRLISVEYLRNWIANQIDNSST